MLTLIFIGRISGKLTGASTLYKTITILYFIVFTTYIFFTRQPDYLDGEITSATIHLVKDSTGKHSTPKAFFSIGINYYTVNANYYLRNVTEGKKVEVIYETAHPEKAVVYSWWGYWITIEELIGSIILFIILFQVAVAVTKNPTAESLMEQMEYEPQKKRKYDD